MKNMHIQAAITILLFSSISISGNYFVDEFGSDVTGDGSSGNPWATVGYAVNQISDTEIFVYCSGTIDETPNGGIVVIPDSLYAPITIDGLGSSIWRVQCDARSIPATPADTVSICNFAELSPTTSGPSEYAIRIGYMTHIHDIDWIHGYTNAIFMEEFATPPPDYWYYGANIYNIGDPGTAGDNGFTQNETGISCLTYIGLVDVYVTNSNLHSNDCGIYAYIEGFIHVQNSHIWQNGAGIVSGSLSAYSNHIYENTIGIECINVRRNTYISSNIIHDNDNYGIYWWIFDYVDPWIELWVTDNEVYLNGASGILVRGEYEFSDLFFNISDNTIYGNSGNGVMLVSEYHQGPPNEIKNNTVTDNDSIGISVELPYHNGDIPRLDLSGNTILSNVSHGCV